MREHMAEGFKGIACKHSDCPEPAVVNLDGADLCWPHANQWAKGERQPDKFEGLGLCERG